MKVQTRVCVKIYLPLLLCLIWYDKECISYEQTTQHHCKIFKSPLQCENIHRKRPNTAACSNTPNHHKQFHSHQHYAMAPVFLPVPENQPFLIMKATCQHFTKTTVAPSIAQYTISINKAAKVELCLCTLVGLFLQG